MINFHTRYLIPAYIEIKSSLAEQLMRQLLTICERFLCWDFSEQIFISGYSLQGPQSVMPFTTSMLNWQVIQKFIKNKLDLTCHNDAVFPGGEKSPSI